MKSLLFLAVMTLSATAQTTRLKVFLDPMEGHMEGFIAAEIMKQGVPVALVTRQQDADFAITGAAIKQDFRSFQQVKDRNEGNVRVIDLRRNQIVWAAEAGDRTLLWFPSWRRGHRRRVADRIVRNIRDKGLAVATATGTAGNGTSGPGYHLENARQ